MLQQPHPFSKFVAILGRGKTRQRHFTLAEATQAMAITLRTMGKTNSIAQAETMAQDIWDARDRAFLPASH